MVRVTKRLYYEVALAPRGYGRPVSTDTWDAQYRHGTWDFLSSLDELAHYMVTVGYIQHLYRDPTMLDVGCGHGRLLTLLSLGGTASYLGIDISTEAIRRTEELRVQNARFEVADFERWKSSQQFDVIVFNETLYYATRPTDVLRRYGQWLNHTGSLIVSMCRYGNYRVIWRDLDRHFEAVATASVENHKRQAWDIKVLRPAG